jgi:hypothetical protein
MLVLYPPVRWRVDDDSEDGCDRETFRSGLSFNPIFHLSAKQLRLRVVWSEIAEKRRSHELELGKLFARRPAIET